MANIGYPLDLLGEAPSNLVVENRTLTRKAIDGRSFVIPKAAPFFADSVVIKHNGIPLEKGRDYHLILPSPELTHEVKKSIFGGIIFNTLNISQVVEITAQTIGGDWNLPINNVVEEMSNLINNPSFSTWSQIVGTPAGLPPNEHMHDWNATKGYDDLIGSLNLLALSIMETTGGASGGNSALIAHTQSPTAHTPSQVGLGNVPNYGLATYQQLSGKNPPANKLTTPRDVLYMLEDRVLPSVRNLSVQLQTLQGIDGDVSQKLTALNTKIKDLEDSLETLDNSDSLVNSNLNGLSHRVDALNVTLSTINSNTQNAIEKYNALNGKFNAVLRDFSTLSSEFEELSNGNADHSTNIDVIKTSLDEIKESLKTHQNLLTKIKQQTLSGDGTIYLVGGQSRKLTIEPGENYSFILVGAGGHNGDYYNFEQDLGQFHENEASTDTVIWCHQDLSNGVTRLTNKPLLVAGAGENAQHSFLYKGKMTHSRGGSGGVFEINPAFKILEASNGESGSSGVGEFTNAVTSNQETGYEYEQLSFGGGGRSLRVVGQGGEGAIIRAEYTNNTKLPIIFDIYSGVVGKSRNKLKSHRKAEQGLVIITKL